MDTGRTHIIERAVMAALMHWKPDYRSPRRLNEAARVITKFVEEALDDTALTSAKGNVG